MAPGVAGPSERLAETDGNRTRPPAHHRCTGFEDQESHQAPFASVARIVGLAFCVPDGMARTYVGPKLWTKITDFWNWVFSIVGAVL